MAAGALVGVQQAGHHASARYRVDGQALDGGIDHLPVQVDGAAGIARHGLLHGHIQQALGLGRTGCAMGRAKDEQHRAERGAEPAQAA